MWYPTIITIVRGTYKIEYEESSDGKNFVVKESSDGIPRRAYAVKAEMLPDALHTVLENLPRS